MAKKPPSPLATIGTAPVGSTEWLNAFDQLSPQDQASVYNFGMNDPTAGDLEGTDFSGGGADFGGGLAGQGYAIPDTLSGMNNASIDPGSQGLIQFGGGVNIPQFTSAGKLDPYDLSQEATRNNLYQDQVTSLMDLGMAGLAGPGAIDPAAFAPIVTQPKDRLKTPGLDLLNRYAKGTGYRAYLAQKILGGATDDEALADLWNQVNKKVDPNDKTISQADRDKQQALINSLPANTFQSNTLVPPSATGGIQGQNQTPAKASVDPYNTAAVVGFASDLFQKSIEDQSALSGAYQDPKTGTYYSDFPTTTDSPATLKFHNAGLPTPVEKYTDPKFIQQAFNTIPDLSINDQAYTGLSQDLQNQQDQASADALKLGQNYDQMAQVWDQYQKQLETKKQADAANNVEQQRAMAATNLNRATAAMPENGPMPAAQQRTLPGINLGGRITGTSSDTYGRVQPPAQPPRSQSQMMQDTFVMPNLHMVADPQQPWARALGNGLFNVGTQAQANAGQTRGPVANPNQQVFDFSNPLSRPADNTAQRMTQQQVSQARTAKQAADRRFIDANTQRFRNATYNTPQSDVNSLNAIWSAQSNKSSPYQDAILQRLLAQRVAGLRGA